MKKLYRDHKNAILGGVCAGIAKYLGIDVTVVRIVFIVLAIIDGFGVLLYLILWILLPRIGHTKNEQPEKKTESEKITASTDYNQRNYLAGAVLLTIGVLLLISNYLPDFAIFEKFWPIILVAIGIGILLNINGRE